MAASPHRRAYFCDVVTEEVTVSLRTRQKGGFNGRSYKVAQCDQELCQYVDENVPPCPLHTGMFDVVLGAEDPVDIMATAKTGGAMSPVAPALAVPAVVAPAPSFPSPSQYNFDRRY